MTSIWSHASGVTGTGPPSPEPGGRCVATGAVTVPDFPRDDALGHYQSKSAGPTSGP
jgi:hypothetical protein